MGTCCFNSFIVCLFFSLKKIPPSLAPMSLWEVQCTPSKHKFSTWNQLQISCLVHLSLNNEGTGLTWSGHCLSSNSLKINGLYKDGYKVKTCHMTTCNNTINLLIEQMFQGFNLSVLLVWWSSLYPWYLCTDYWGKQRRLHLCHKGPPPSDSHPLRPAAPRDQTVHHRLHESGAVRLFMGR